MNRHVLRVSGGVLLLALLTSACNEGSETPSAPTRVGYAGEWSGSSLQGDTLAFSVSAEQRVTTISIHYSLNGCSGTKTFSGLSVEIAPLPGNGRPAFVYQSAEGDLVNFISVQVSFSSSDTATGITVLDNFAGCRGGPSLWSAQRP
jgi:hypothetical protein